MRLINIVAITLISFAAISCGKSSKNADQNPDTATVAEINVDEILNGDAAKMTESLDNRALFADDLEPQEAVAVLVGYLEIEKDAKTARRTRKELETMRKFVDVYDIAISNHGDKMRSAIRQYASTKGVDLSVVAREFRDRLRGVDEGSGIEATPVSKPDSAATDSAITQTEAVQANHDMFN